MNRTLLLLLLMAWSLPAAAERLSTAIAADPLRLAAEDAASCRELRDPDVRLACLDAAAHRLAEALGSMDQAGRNAGDLPIGPDAPDAPAAVEPSGEATEHPPNWASAPQHRDIEQAEIPRVLYLTIISRIGSAIITPFLLNLSDRSGCHIDRA